MRTARPSRSCAVTGGRARRYPGQQPAPPLLGASRRGRRLAADARRRRLAAALVSSPSLKPPATLAIGANTALAVIGMVALSAVLVVIAARDTCSGTGIEATPSAGARRGISARYLSLYPAGCPRGRGAVAGAPRDRRARDRPRPLARPPKGAQASTTTAAAPARCSSTRKTDRPRRGSARGSRAIATAPRTSVPARFLGTSVKLSVGDSEAEGSSRRLLRGP
jgi:hypothetical protein